MSDQTSILAKHHTEVMPLPAPRIAISIRAGEMSDLAFVDALQKKHTHQVGFMQMGALEGKIKLGHVLIAESDGERVGYCMGNDQYYKRDDLGIIFQLNVMSGKQRGLIGASLLKAQFERSAYGCRLYCCWCAQDLEANRFWEACGFVPIAFRAGSEKKSRVHIFWQKRIREGDTTTPWWYPSKTSGGAMGEDRIALPIPFGTHWSDAKPLIFPVPSAVEGPTSEEETKAITAPVAKSPRAKKEKKVESPEPVRRNGLTFAIPQPGEKIVAPTSEKKAKEKAPRVKRKANPQLVAAARELRDRWMEKVNENPMLLMSEGKYDVARALGHLEARPIALLDAA